MIVTRIRSIAAIAAALLASSCSQSPAPAKAQAAPEKIAHPANDFAQFLAGIPGPADGPYHALEQTDSWRKYSSDLGALWAKADKEQFIPVDNFQKRELAPLPHPSSFIFYPFGGPDVLYVTRFFPNGKTYVLVGLEPVGGIRSASAYAGKDLDRELAGWNRALSSIFNRTFFVTSEMDHDFRGSVSNGVLSTILLLMARSGHTIESIQFGKVDTDGKWVPLPEDQKKPMGVMIDFHKGAGGASRKLYYFSTKLDTPFAEDPSFSRFVRAQGTPDTLVKSASFLLHWKMCEAIRAQILETSNIILQDDTGVPYGLFKDASQWKVQLYGEYSRPDRPFTSEYQKDLAADFKVPEKVKPLGFWLGYGSHRRPSSMMLAQRVK